jgi:hypothetical protein
MGEKWPRILPKVTTSTSLLGSFTCRKAQHGTDRFTSSPKEGVLRIFLPENPTASAGIISFHYFLSFLRGNILNSVSYKYIVLALRYVRYGRYCDQSVFE